MGRVCVIGAGFAGLAAADALTRGGYEVVVAEARDRVGGRVWSDRLATGALIERGAEFITAGYTTTEAYAARFGLALDGMGIRYPDRALRPDPGLDRGAVLTAAAAVERAAAAAPTVPALDLLAATVADPSIAELFASRLQSARSHPVEDLSAGFLRGISKYLADEECRRIRGGNDGIARGLAAGLDVRLGTPARAVRSDRRGVHVEVDGGTIDAEVVVCAVPVAVIGDLVFEPALPGAVVEEIRATRTGVAAKLAAPLRAAVPADAIMSVPRRFWAYTTPCDEIGGRTVGSWAGASPVLEDLAADAGAERWLAAIGELWPELDVDADGASVTVWRDDPWAGGSYSVLEPIADPVTTLGAPVGRVAFAGEHTSGDWGATIEGALRSGERAAGEVLATLDRP
jgi:monoamine oxidase